MLISLGIVSALLGSALLPPATAHAVESSDDRAAQTVQDYVDAFATPGVAAAVLTLDGVEQVVTGRDGLGAAITSDTPFRIASLSKSMTATAIMVLVQDGALDLDDRVVD